MEHKFSFKKVLSILVVLTMVFSSVAAFAFTADAEGEDVILIDAINAASWGEDDVPFAPILVYGTENNVGGYIGGVWNAWWYKIIATYDKDADLFIVDEFLRLHGFGIVDCQIDYFLSYGSDFLPHQSFVCLQSPRSVTTS